MENGFLKEYETLKNYENKLMDYLLISHYYKFNPIMKNELMEHIENQKNRIYLFINIFYFGLEI